MTSGLPQSPAYAGSSPCAVGVLIAAGTLLLESDVELFLMEKITCRLTEKGYHHIFAVVIAGLLNKSTDIFY